MFGKAFTMTKWQNTLDLQTQWYLIKAVGFEAQNVDVVYKPLAQRASK